MRMVENNFPVIGFGKLSTYGDFVRYNAAGKEIQALDRWFQEGILSVERSMHSHWEITYLGASPYYFVFSPDFSEKSLFGIFFPSRDKVGRKYPFIIALVVDRRQIGQESIPYIPVIFKTFIEKAYEVGNDTVKTLMTPNIPELMSQLSDSVNLEITSMLKLYEDFKDNTSIQKFISRVWGSFDQDLKYYIIKNLTRLIQSFQENTVTRLSYGLRIPVGIDSNFKIYDATFCSELILKILPHNSMPPNQFFANSGSQRPSYLFHFFSPPSPKNFAGLIQLDQELDTIYSLDTPVTSTSAGSESLISPELGYLLESGDRSLNELLQQL